ncbi:MAG: hypothetical protein ACI8ZB_002678 [Desulforhopalus sp.]|jgi:hypothetical protein
MASHLTTNSLKSLKKGVRIRRILTCAILLSFASISPCIAVGLNFYKLTECSWAKQKELRRDVAYALKDKATIKRCYQMDKRKEFLIVAKTGQGTLGIYLDEKTEKLLVEDKIKNIVSKWEADNK